MPIEFRCSECATMLRVDDANQGKMARCPKCGMINPIPTSSPSEPAAPTPRATEQPTSYYLPPDTELWTMRGVDGTTYGPVRLEELRRWLQEGRINHQCSLQREGDSTWQPAMDVLMPSMAVGSEKPSAPMGTFPAYNLSQYQPHNGTAILLLACIGTVLFPCAVIAAFMGHNELKRIRAGRVDPSGESLVRAGYVIGIIFSILGILPWMCCCLSPIISGPNFRF